MDYKLNPAAAEAILAAEAELNNAGLPGYMDVVRALARAAMVLDGRDKRTSKAAIAKRAAALLEPLRPGSGAAEWSGS